MEHEDRLGDFGPFVDVVHAEVSFELDVARLERKIRQIGEAFVRRAQRFHGPWRIMPAVTARHTESPITLLRRAAGPPRVMRGKLARLARVAAGYASPARLDDRLERLHRRGHIERIPTRLQLALGGVDMLRFFIKPAAADYYERQGIDFHFHQLLRFLDEPASLTDAVGLFSTRDNVIGHLMQVVHANPIYDLQLLDMWSDGLDELERQLEAMIAGTHPRSGSIGAIVEEPDYRERLLDFVRRWRKDPTIPPLLRSNVEADPRFRDLEAIFGTLTSAMKYFCALPTSLSAAVRHLRTVDDPRSVI